MDRRIRFTTNGLFVGDIVQLKTGSPAMEIAGLSPHGLAYCVWTENGLTTMVSFAPERLELLSSAVSHRALTERGLSVAPEPSATL